MVRWRFVLGLVLLPIIFHIFLHSVFSRDRVFNQIHLGSPYVEAMRLLDRAGVACNMNAREKVQGKVSPNVTCHFEDPWRNYTVVFHPDLGIVTGKIVEYKRDLPIHAQVVYYLINPPRL